MKKLVSVFVLCSMVTSVAGAVAARPSHLKRDANGGYTVTYDYKDKEKTGWYVAARAGVDFLNWKNKYSFTDPGQADAEDKFSFEPVFDGSLAAGYHFGYFWRGELELGYWGQFTDSDSGLDFKMSAPYLMANGYYDFLNGIYVGAGVGVAVPSVSIDGASPVFVVTGGDNDKTAVSPMVAGMVGYSTKLDDNLVLDLRYRLAGLNGVKHKFDYVNSDGGFVAENKIGLILDNSLSIGIRYEF